MDSIRPGRRAMLLLAASCLAITSHAFSSASPPPIDPSGVDKTATQRELQSSLAGEMILAPLTRGGNLPFRRLCADFGMNASVSEMIYARSLVGGSPVESARCCRSDAERTFGVQIATNRIEEGLDAVAKVLRDAEGPFGAPDFVDLNCGCPIFDVTRRGLGSSLLRSPKKLGSLVAGLVDGSDVPITVKIRLGCESDMINALENVKAIREAGASAITIHGRTAQQGYSNGADWELIRRAVVESREAGYGRVPIVGNGDILTHYEARRRLRESGAHSVMVGRGALTKPWIFREFADGATWSPGTRERVEVYRALARYMKDHFGDDAMGRKKAWTFLPWHFQFLSRYRPHPEEEFGERSAEMPLIQTRDSHVSDDPLEALLANRNGDVHDVIASILWESDSDDVAFRKLSEYAESDEFEEVVLAGGSSDEDKVLANPLPGGRDRKRGGRRGRKPGPKRSDEEITRIRAERAEKKARILASGGQWPPN
ncbi:hypothetical protein ACHAWF_013548 [Thalassiosira exigua]